MGSTQMKYDVLLSYLPEDRGRATELRVRLAELGIHVFDATVDMLPGEDLASRLEGALETSRFLVLMIGPDTFKSSWINFEVGAALSMRKGIIPILSKNVDQKDLPLLILSRVSLSTENVDEMAQQIGAAVRDLEENNIPGSGSRFTVQGSRLVALQP
ncbi:MAG: toll/interleukin-1 receptor domain-containing protein [bacterium]|nr:toll/interleukin-1 receptor domain-containing protein [bacterium]